MEGHRLIEALKKGLMAAVRQHPDKTEKEIFLDLSIQMYHDHNARVSSSWVRNMLYQTYDPSVIKALALYNVLKKMQLIQHDIEDGPMAINNDSNGAKHETWTAEHGPEDIEDEPLVYFQMLKDGKL